MTLHKLCERFSSQIQGNTWSVINVQMITLTVEYSSKFMNPFECDFNYLKRMKDDFFALVTLSQSTTEVDRSVSEVT